MADGLVAVEITGPARVSATLRAAQRALASPADQSQGVALVGVVADLIHAEAPLARLQRERDALAQGVRMALHLLEGSPGVPRIYTAPLRELLAVCGAVAAEDAGDMEHARARLGDDVDRLTGVQR